MLLADNSCGLRSALNNRSLHAGQQFRLTCRQEEKEPRVLTRVLADEENSCVSWFEVRLQYQDKMCLLALVGVFSRLSSSSHGHGGKLRLKVINSLRDSPILRDLASFAQYLSCEQPIDNGESPSSLIVHRYYEVDS